MSTRRSTPEMPKADPYEVMVHERLSQTQRQVKGVDIASGLLVLTIGAVGYLLVAAVVDHWLVDGGLGFWGRLLLLLGLLGGGGYYLVMRIAPTAMNRISPLFAAHTIEQGRPSLKNSLMNFVLLRGHRQ